MRYQAHVRMLTIVLMSAGFLSAAYGIPMVGTRTADAVSINPPFGGRVLFTIPCTCGPLPGSMLVMISGPSWGTYVYAPGVTRLYKYYLPTVPSVWLLGNYARFGQCWQYAVLACFPTPVPIKGTMLQVGTSRPGL